VQRAAFALGLTLLLAGSPARADETPASAGAIAPRPTPAPVDLVAPDPPGLVQRNIGVALTGGGLLMGITGTYILVRSQTGGCACTSARTATMGALIGLGSAMTVAGIPLWIVGQRRLDRANPTSAQVTVGPLSAGLRLTF
jgi:hypothetical protein